MRNKFAVSLLAGAAAVLAGPALAASPGDVVITEILYNADANPETVETQFVEIYNTTGASIDLTGWTIDDEDADGPNSLSGTLPAGGVGLIVGSTAADFNAAFSPPAGVLVISVADASETMFNMSNSPDAAQGAEVISLYDGSSNLIDEVNYDDSGDWPGDPGGVSIYLTIGNLDAVSNDNGLNWALPVEGVDDAYVSGTSGPWNANELTSAGFIPMAGANPVIQAAYAFNGDIVVDFDVPPDPIGNGDVDVTYDVLGAGTAATIVSTSLNGDILTIDVDPDPSVDGLLDDVNVASNVNANQNFYAYPTIDLIQTGFFIEGETVGVRGTVTAVTDASGANGLDTGDGDFAIATAAGANNGVFVDDDGANAPVVGNLVDVVGQADEWFNNTVISGVNVSSFADLGPTTPIAPTVIPASEFQADGSGGLAEQWEGVLIRFESLSGPVTNPDDPSDFNERALEGVRFDDHLFAIAPIFDANLSASYNVTGIGSFSFGNYKVWPRTAADIEVLTSVNDWTAFD